MYNLQTFNLFVLDIKCWLVPDVKVHKSCIPTQKILFWDLLTCSSWSKDLGQSMYKPLQNAISNKWVERLEHYLEYLGWLWHYEKITWPIGSLLIEPSPHFCLGVKVKYSFSCTVVQSAILKAFCSISQCIKCCKSYRYLHLNEQSILRMQTNLLNRFVFNTLHSWYGFSGDV